MANEVKATATLTYGPDSEYTSDSLQMVAMVKSVTTKKVLHVKQAIPITEAAINLGGIAAPAYAMFINRDTTNIIDLKVGTAGAIFARLDPDTNADGNGGFALLKLGSGAQVPYAIALVAPCQMEVFIISL